MNANAKNIIKDLLKYKPVVGKCGCGYYNYSIGDYETKCSWHEAVETAEKFLKPPKKIKKK